MEKVGAPGDEGIRISVFVILIIRSALRYVSDMTSRLRCSPSAVRLERQHHRRIEGQKSLQKKS